MRAVIYARRSTEKQEASVPTQIEEAQRFINAKGWSLVGEYRDEDRNTGRKEFVKRRGFLKLLADAEDGTFDVVVVRDNTRLGGDMSRTMRAVEDLRERGISLWYYIDGREVRLDSWIDKAAFAMQNAASEGERDGISSRTFESLKVRARSGQNVGGKIFGYRNVPIMDGSKRLRTEFQIDEAEAAVVRRIFNLYADGAGFHAIARQLNCEGVPKPRVGKRGGGTWVHSVVRGMLRNERYAGVLVYGRKKKTYQKGTKVRIDRPADDAEIIRVERPDLRIIDEVLWLKVAAIVEGRSFVVANRHGRKPRHLLTGLSVCVSCGRPMKVSSRGAGRGPSYLCRGYHEEGTCKNNLSQPVAEVEAAVVGALAERLADDNLVARLMEKVRSRLSAQRKAADETDVPQLQQDAKKLRAELDRLAEAVAVGGTEMTVLLTKMRERQAQLAGIDTRLHAAKHASGSERDELRRAEEEIRGRLGNLREEFAKADPVHARRAMESFLTSKVTFTPVETADGPRYRIEGSACLGGHLVTRPNVWRPQGESNPR